MFANVPWARSTLWLDRVIVALALLAAMCGPSALVAEEPKGAFEVHDLSLWIIEPGSQQANLRTAYPSAFPGMSRSSVASSVPPTGPNGTFVAAGGRGVVQIAAQGNPSIATAPRRDASALRVGPVNLIRFYGQPAANLDLDLRTKAGSFVGHWPAAESLPNRLRWAGTPKMDLVDKLEDESGQIFVDSEHWIRKARQGQALFVHRGARTERFLAYDAELNLPPPIRLEGGPDTFKVINTTSATLHDVLITRDTPQGRRVAWLDTLGPAKSAVTVPEAKPAQAQATATDVFGDGKAPAPAAATPPLAPPAAIDAKAAAQQAEAARQKAAAEQARAAAEEKLAAAKKAEADKKAEMAKKKQSEETTGLSPALEKKAVERERVKRFLETQLKPQRGAKQAAKPAEGVEVTLSEPLAAGSDETKAKTRGALSERLSRTGLNGHEVELFLENYASLFFESDGVVVACRLDAGAIDEKIPLSVFPEPTKLVRVPIVVQRNADPQLGSQVERLVAQLGDPKFAVREAAQARLIELGALAFTALQQALNDPDLEVVIRAERILLFHNQTPNPQAKPKVGARAVRGLNNAAAGGNGGAAVFRVSN